MVYVFIVYKKKVGPTHKNKFTKIREIRKFQLIRTEISREAFFGQPHKKVDFRSIRPEIFREEFFGQPHNLKGDCMFLRKKFF